MAVPDMRTADAVGESFARLPEIAFDELESSLFQIVEEGVRGRVVVRISDEDALQSP